MKILKSLFILFSVLFLASLATNSYFTDQATIAGNTFQAGTWPTTPNVVINEVYYDVDGNHGSEGAPQNDEWIELYNNTGSSISLQNWSITDNYETVIIHADKSIPANGFVLLSKSANTWTYWGINPGSPGAGIEVIEMGQFVMLSNTGDQIVLKDQNGTIVDQISYGTNATILNPAIPDVAEGHSIERNPKGHDTDTASDFINQTPPTPGSGL